MKTLLRIDASLRVEGSHTYELTEYFTSLWLENNPDGKVIHRCLSQEKIPEMTNDGYNSFFDPNSKNDTIRLSDQLIKELKIADMVLIGSPLYNLGTPAGLKNYFDHVVRCNKTFEVTDEGLKPLLKDKTAVVITSRAGIIDPQVKDDFQTEYIEGVFKFIGIDQVSHFSLDGTYLEDKAVIPRVKRIKALLSQYFHQPSYPEWSGRFTDQDKADIEALREGQAEAIMAGDANAYIELCADDVRLMLPGFPTVRGREDFLLTEENVFKKARFTNFKKYPLAVEFANDLAFETGVQEVATEGVEQTDGIFATTQKYTHIFRRTEQGWRFAVLTSNAND